MASHDKWLEGDVPKNGEASGRDPEAAEWEELAYQSFDEVGPDDCEPEPVWMLTLDQLARFADRETRVVATALKEQHLNAKKRGEILEFHGSDSS